MIATTTSSDGITGKGLRALRDSLGPSGMIEFVQTVRRGSGDYVRERARVFDRMSVQDVAEAIDDPAAGESARDGYIEIQEEAKRVARLAPAKRERWLRALRSAFAMHPERDAIIQTFREYMRAVRRQDATALRVSHVEEMLEADAYWRLERLLNGEIALPTDPDQALFVIAYLAMAGHFLPHLRRRFQEPDAQKFLSDRFTGVLLGGRTRAGHIRRQRSRREKPNRRAQQSVKD